MIDELDPRLTAYVLGELDDHEEAELAAAIEASPGLQRAVADIRRTCATLEAALAAEPATPLTAAQRAAIDTAASEPEPAVATQATPANSAPAAPARRRWLRRSVLSLAASLLLAGVGVALWTPGSWREHAIHNPLAQHPPGRSIEHAHAAATGRPAEADFDSLVELQTTPSEGVHFRFFNGQTEFAGGEGSNSVVLSERDGGTVVIGGVQREGRDSGGRSSEQPPADDLSRDSFEFRYGRGGGRDPGDLLDRISGTIRTETWAEQPPGESREIERSAMPFDDRPIAPAAGPAPAGPRITEPATERLAAPATARPGSALQRDSEQELREAAPASRRPASGVILPLAATPAPAEPTAEADELAKDDAPSSGRGPQAAERPLSQSGADADVEDKKTKIATEPQRTWRRARATPNASRLTIGDRDELPLEGLQINVLVDGFRARVLLDTYYYNDRDRPLEGAFQLRLPDEASLYYFAFGETSFEYRPQVDKLASKGFLPAELVRASGAGPAEILRSRSDSWTNVKEARVVPREKAAYAYSETVRRRVDPALVEWAGAGVFNAKVFPLAPRKLHRIVIGYDINLRHEGSDLVYQLAVPEDVGQLSVDVSVAAAPGLTVATTPDRGAPFVASGRAYYHFDAVGQEGLAVRIAAPGVLALAGADAATGDYFAVEATPSLPDEGPVAGSSRAVLLLDTSLSSRPDKFNIWLALLEKILAENRDAIDEFAVLRFHVGSSWWREQYTKNTPENVAALLADCRQLALEGATDLEQALRFANQTPWLADGDQNRDKDAPAAIRPDVFLLSDGAITWGAGRASALDQAVRGGALGPVFAYRTGLAGTSTGVLDAVARSSGGAVFAVVGEEELAAAARAHRLRPWRLVDVAAVGGSDLLVAGRPTAIYPGQRLLIVGRGQPQGEVLVNVERDGQQQHVPLRFDRTLRSDLTARLYGQAAVGQLEDVLSAAEDVAVAYARHFRVPGQACSLVMLETEQDYLRFNIKPEDDAFVVASTPAAPLFERIVERAIAEQLDPKASLLAWLARLEKAPGVNFQLSTPLKLALERVDSARLAPPPRRLAIDPRRAADLPTAYRQALAEAELAYDPVVVEADRLARDHQRPAALVALSSLIEATPGDTALARDVAFSALEWGLPDQAYVMLHRVAEMRPYEPQTYLALGRCLADAERADLAVVYYEVVLGGQWMNRYGDLRRIAAVEYSHLLRRIDAGELECSMTDLAAARRAALAKEHELTPADLVVTMMWSTDRTDVDLHVVEPDGFTCFFQQPRSPSGGVLTQDVTEGFGPEMYTHRNAPPGKYAIKAHYYGGDANRTAARTRVYVTLYRDFGRPEREQVERRTVLLGRTQETRELAELHLKPPAK